MRNTLETKTYTVRDVAAAVGVSVPTAYRLARQGEFGAVRIGKSVRVPARNLAAWALAAGHYDLVEQIEEDLGTKLV